MATKNHCLSLKQEQKTFVGDSSNDQYRNLNLNHNKPGLFEETVKCVTAESRKDGNYDLTVVNTLQKRSGSLSSGISKHKLSSDYMKEEIENHRKEFDNLEKASSKSTLSLHITAYENATKGASDSKNGNKNDGSIEKCKITKEFLVFGSAVKTPFEFPRQQDNNQAMNPEVMQFKASQQLINPDQNPSSVDPQLQSGVRPTSAAAPPQPVESSTSATSDGSILPSRSEVTTTSTLTEKTQIVSPNPPILSPLKDTSCKDCPTPVSSVSSIQPHHSVSNYDPSVARLNLPKDVIANLEKLVSQPPKATPTNIDPDAPTPGMTIRFYTSLLVLASIGILGLVANSYGSNALSGIAVACLTVFAFHWFWVYGSGLSRHKRTYFNEKNVLDTYKIYDRELGHLFQKEPDTPGNCCGPPPQPGDPNVPVNPVQNVANDLLAQYKAPPKEKAEFSASVQDHYGNMYDNIRRINQEMDLMAKAKQANADAERLSAAAGSTTNAPSNDPLIPHATSAPLVPADIPLPGQINKKSSNNNETKS